MTFKRTIIYVVAIILMFSNVSFAAGETNVEMLIQEKNSLRNEIIRLKLLLGENEKVDNVPVFLYHHILPQKDIDTYGWVDNASVVSLEDFREQMTYLYENNYHTATLDELESFINGEIDLPKKTVVITFDDGYLSNGVYAYPIMKEYGMKGTIFIWKKALLPSAEFSPEGLQYINYHDDYSDVFDFQSHTFNMHWMNEEKDKSMLEIATYDEIMEDLLISQGLLNCKYIAYPFGRSNQDTLDILEELGFRLAFTVSFGYVTKETPKFELPRIIIYPNTPIEKFIDYIN